MDWRCAKIEGDTITINKKDLEEARDHYLKVVQKKEFNPTLFLYYTGKSDVLTDLLKQFEQLEL